MRAASPERSRSRGLVAAFYLLRSEDQIDLPGKHESGVVHNDVVLHYNTSLQENVSFVVWRCSKLLFTDTFDAFLSVANVMRGGGEWHLAKCNVHL